MGAGWYEGVGSDTKDWGREKDEDEIVWIR